MNYIIKEFKEEYLESAVELFLNNYQHEKEKNILLPPEIIDEPDRILNSLKPLMKNTGIAMFNQNKLIAYMITGAKFNFKGQKTSLVPEFCHGSIKADKKNIYQQMYMKLSTEWIKDSIHLHIIGHFANDIELKETIYQLGFGAFLSEKIRDFSPIIIKNRNMICEENDFSKLIDIQIEHNKYYKQAPIFITKRTERNKVLEDLENYNKSGDIFLVCYENNKPSGYFIIGNSELDGEGFLLKNTKTAQIKSAYVRPEYRRKGIGASLLHEVINWSEKNQYKRLFVEHETANYYGGHFWCKHFKPYLYFSMRYIDNSI